MSSSDPPPLPHHDHSATSATVDITGEIMVVAIIVLFLVVVFVLFLHLYAKWFWWRTEQPPPQFQSRRRRRNRFVFAPGQDPSSVSRTGLDPVLLKSIPLVEDFKEGIECAVCLSELVRGEKARFLPKCNHGFHVECIDMWFQSHSTCPLCRNLVDGSVVGQDGSVRVEVVEVVVDGDNGGSGSVESPVFPTNVLVWGNECQVSTSGGLEMEEAQSSSSSSSSTSSSTSSSDSMVVVDVEDEEEKSGMQPTRLRSFRRLLSREKKVVSDSSSNEDCR